MTVHATAAGTSATAALHSLEALRVLQPVLPLAMLLCTTAHLYIAALALFFLWLALLSMQAIAAPSAYAPHARLSPNGTSAFYAHALSAERMHPYAALLRADRINPLHLQLALTDRDFDSNDYEALLALDEEVRAARPSGLSQEAINMLPSYTLCASRKAVGDGAAADGGITGEPDIFIAGSPRLSLDDCVVCLEPKQPGDYVRTLPCLHTFHTCCIDPWLRASVQCPVCKYKVALPVN